MIYKVQLEYDACTASIYCVPFSFGKPLVKKTFFKSFPKTPDLDLI